MSVPFLCCVLSSRGLCDQPIIVQRVLLSVVCLDECHREHQRGCLGLQELLKREDILSNRGGYRQKRRTVCVHLWFLKHRPD